LGVSTSKPFTQTAHYHGLHPALSRPLRHFPFTPIPPTDVLTCLYALRAELPSGPALGALLDAALSRTSTLFFAFTPQRARALLSTATYGPPGPSTLHALSALYGVLGVGALYAGAPPAPRYAELAGAALAAGGALTAPSLEAVEALFARGALELLASTDDDGAQHLLALAAQMCYSVRAPRRGPGVRG
jgi:hypothetical protein